VPVLVRVHMADAGLPCATGDHLLHARLRVAVAQERALHDYEVNIKGASWKSQGARLRVTRMALRDRADFRANFDEFDQPEACYTDIYEGNTIVALDMEVVNKTGRDIEWYADQAELVLGTESVTGDLLGPDELGVRSAPASSVRGKRGGCRSSRLTRYSNWVSCG
jgi:hypothetical protein